MTDIRSKLCVFVSHCMLAQGIMANGIVKRFPGPVKPVLQFCLENDINIMQMPCPETICASGGLGRDPHGKKWYEENGLRETSKKIAASQADYMQQLVTGGFKILAIIGVDFSPACAVNYLNKGYAVYKDQGIYIEELKQALNERKLDFPFIGINQRWLKKLERDLISILDNSSARETSRPKRKKRETPKTNTVAIAAE